jgi:hypothetical protein
MASKIIKNAQAIEQPVNEQQYIKSRSYSKEEIKTALRMTDEDIDRILQARLKQIEQRNVKQ